MIQHTVIQHAIILTLYLVVPKYTPAVASKGRASTEVKAANAPNLRDPRRGSTERRRYSDRELATNGPMLSTHTHAHTQDKAKKGTDKKERLVRTLTYKQHATRQKRDAQQQCPRGAVSFCDVSLIGGRQWNLCGRSYWPSFCFFLLAIFDRFRLVEGGGGGGGQCVAISSAPTNRKKRKRRTPIHYFVSPGAHRVAGYKPPQFSVGQHSPDIWRLEEG